ncbi:TRAP transporter small permease [Corynebacterium sp. A21]|uniref:TRAP transporter small permease n=1 Tax=Corynebacterium sp. A21 TaxID=3457318 RepID=UPI003FD5C328
MGNTATNRLTTSSPLLDRIDKAVNVLVRVSLYIGGAAALAMVINVFLDVVLRFLLNSPIQGTNQFVSFWWMLPVVFFGLAAAQQYGEHTDLPIVHDHLSDRGQAVIALVALTCTGLFALLIGWFGLGNALDQAIVGEYDSSTGVTIWPPRFAIPIACLAFVMIIIAQMLREISRLLTSPRTSSDPDSVLDDNEMENAR